MQPLAVVRQQLFDLLGPLPPACCPAPTLLIVAGLPGSGKSTLSRRLAQEAPAVVVSSDAIRHALFHPPTYAPRESGVVFRLAHALTDDLLRRSVTVIFDATNLVERNRRPLYRIARRAGAQLLLVWVTAPEPVVQERLAARQLQPDADSDADWTVYQRMAPSAQPFRREHMVADTSEDLAPVVQEILMALCADPRPAEAPLPAKTGG